MAVAMAAVLSACVGSTVYHHYEAVSMSGWEKNDTLVFDVPPMTADCICHRQLGLRISSDYPFMGLTLIVEQLTLPSHHFQRDTLNCNIINAHGNPLGHGISRYQYQFPLPAVSLDSGQSLRITVRHDMKREILPGITDIGMELSR
jgi:gliding motility-associated lipoprotein GldH